MTIRLILIFIAAFLLFHREGNVTSLDAVLAAILFALLASEPRLRGEA